MRVTRICFAFVVVAMGLLFASASAGTFTVTNTADGDTGSLRDAITAANNNIGADTLVFNIAGNFVHTIQPLSPLPIITDALYINGYSQPGSTANTLAIGNNARILIELNGSLAGGGASGIEIRGNGNSIVRGLVVNGFIGAGIALISGNNIVEGCFVGTDTTGTQAIPNTSDGVFIANGTSSSSNNRVGGTTAAARNLLSGNGRNGMTLDQVSNNFIYGNYIGTNAAGTAAVANNEAGIGIFKGSGNRIGDVTAAHGNVISGNMTNGVEFVSVSNVIFNNYIGTNAAGTAAIPNVQNGIVAKSGNFFGSPEECRDNQIGGANAGNVISGNGGSGILLLENSTFSNIMRRNYIGTTFDGTASLGNGGDGITILSARDNVIGDQDGGERPMSALSWGNAIAYNGGSGVSVSYFGEEGETPIRNSIWGNAIYSNGGLGIDLFGDGVTPNSLPSFSANNRQPYPVLNYAAFDLQAVQGSLRANPNTQYYVEFFSNNVADPTGYGEGKKYIGFTFVNTDDSGDGFFYTTLPGQLVLSEYITATATDPNGNTSEFSASALVGTKVKIFGNHYVINTTLSGIPLHWNDGNVTYKIHNSVPAQFRSAMGAGFDSWSALPQIQYFNGGTTDTATWGGSVDGLNNNVWVTNGWTDLTEADTNVIAVTRVRYNSLTGEIIDADIAYNAQRFSFAVVNGVNTTDMDVENVVAHEAGHFGGMGDIYNPGFPGYIPEMGNGNEFVSMFGLIRRGEVSKRSLESPDTAGIGYIYSHIPQRRVDVALVFDGATSYASTLGAFTPSKNSAIELVQRMRNGDRLSVIKLPNTVALPLTTLQDSLSRVNAIAAINSVVAGGASAIGSGLQTAQTQLTSSPLANQGKAVILFSNGEENAAPPALSVAASLRTANIPVYTLGFAGSSGQGLANAIADTTRGSYYLASNATMNQVVQQMWNDLIGYQLLFRTVAGSDTLRNVLPPGVAWQGPIGPGNAVIFPGVAWQGPIGPGGSSSPMSTGGNYVLSIKAPGGSILIDSAYVAQNPQLGIQFFSGPNFAFYRVTNPQPGVWTLYVYARNQPVQPEPVTLSITGLADITMNFGFDQANYAPNEPMILEATVTSGGPITGDPHVTGGGPITDATVVAEMRIPNSSTTTTLPLGHIGNGVYRGTFTNTSQTGTYDALFRATKDTIERSGQLSAFVSDPNPPPPTGIQSDDFNGTTLKPFWTFINPGNPTTMSFVGTGTADARLRWQIPDGASHDVWIGGNRAPRIMQAAPNEDFEVEVKFDGQMTTQYQIEGIIVEQDANTFLRFDFVRGNSNTRIFVAHFIGGNPTVRRDVVVPNGNPAWMRVKREGNSWTQSYSYDGIAFTRFPAFTHTLTVNAIGPFAGNAGYPEGTAPAFNALVDYFFNTASPIVPEDGVSVPPTITTPPQNATVSSGQTATFNIAATGTLPLAYQWQRSSVNIVGATSASYTTPPTTLADNGAAFRCIVSNSLGTVTSSAAILTVLPAGGASGILSDDFNTSTLKPFWTFVNPPVASTLSLVGTGTSDARLSIAVPAGSSHDVWSGGNNAPRIMQPANNSDFEVEVKFEQPMTSAYQIEGVIVQQDITNFIRFGFVRDFSRTRLFAATFVGGSPTIRHDIDITGALSPGAPISHIGDDDKVAASNEQRKDEATKMEIPDEAVVPQSYPFDGVGESVAIGEQISVEKISNEQGELDSPPTASLYLRVKRVGNQWTQSYSVDGVNFIPAPNFAHTLIMSSVGPYIGNAGFPASNAPAFTGLIDYFFNTATPIIPEDGTATPPIITTQPENRTVGVGQSATFTVGASGSTPLVFQWQKNTTNIPGATNPSYATPVAAMSDNGATFRCVVSNSAGTVTSNSATLTVTSVTNPSGIISDDFRTGPLSASLWTFTNPGVPSTLSFTGTGTANALLSIAVPANSSHDIWTSGNNAPRIMQAANNTDFEIEIKFQSAMSAAYQMQGALVQQDTSNFLRFGFVRDPSNARAFAASFVAGAPTARADVIIPNNIPLYLRVKREGNLWTQSYSTNGTAYTIAGSFTHTLAVSSVGLYAGNASLPGSPAPAFVGLTDYFFNTAFPIVPEDGFGAGPMKFGGEVASVKRVPTQFELAPNFPNPFNPSTTIEYGLPVAATVSVKVYNTLGQEVATLVDGNSPAGYHQVVWNAANVGSGVYVYRMTASSGDGAQFVRTAKMILMK